MNESVDRPLVTIAMMTYNQEKYVRDSVRGILSQTYEPLEIIISDDCSTDRTWDIILEEVETYKKAGGIHKNVILKRNERNLGIAAHGELMGGYRHGEIVIGCGGDDISLPNRAEVIVDAFLRAGTNASVLMHGVILIDDHGRKIGECGSRSEKEPMGAAMAWRRREGLMFPPVTEKNAYEDRIGMNRMRISGGDVLRIEDRLICYRLGTGVSSSLTKHRLADIKSEKGIIASYRQSLLDLEFVKGLIPQECYNSLKKEFNEEKCQREYLLQLYEANDIRLRYHAFSRLGKYEFGVKTRVLQIVYLLPHWLCDLILNGHLKLKLFLKRFRLK